MNDPTRKPVELVTMTHEDWGEAKTYWQWRHLGHGLYRWQCVGVEFSVFCPQEEQDRLVAWLRPVRAQEPYVYPPTMI